MAEENQPGPPNAKKMTRAHFQAIVDAQFRNFLLDVQMNPVLRMKKEIEDLQRQIYDLEQEAATYEKTIEVIIKTQENFLHKFGLLPKQGTRTVGVNVNITSKDERSLPSADMKSNLPKQLQTNSARIVTPQQALSKPIKTEPGVAPALASQSTKPGIQKRSAVDIVDLTMEDDKNRIKQVKSEPLASVTPNYGRQTGNTETPTPGSQLVQRDNVNYATVPLMTSLPPMIQIGSPPVQFPGSSQFTSFIGASKAMPPGMAQPQRIAYVLPSNAPLSVVPRVAVAGGKPGEVSQKLVNGVQSVLLARQPGHIFTGRNAIEAYPGAAKVAAKHPAPLPEPERYTKLGIPLEPPPKPSVKINKSPSGIVLSWNLTLTASHDTIKAYQIYGYEETNSLVDSTLWKKVGEVNALPLPMACTLTQFADNRRYHFAIRAVDVHKRTGPFSDVASITLVQGSSSGK